MKKIIALIAVLAMVFTLASCGSDKSEESDTTEVALISSGERIDDGSFNEFAWNFIETFCDENEITYGYYMVKDNASDEDIELAVKEAISKGSKLLIFAGSNFEKNVYDLQKDYKDVNFSLIDGVPNNGDGKYALQNNSQGILFAEEEAGYLAGYAAAVEGYKNIGFIGGKDLPAVKRYGYGFVQGIKAASREKKLGKITINYTYAGTFEQSADVQKMADSWFKDGTEVIFACGGSMGKSVIKAAEKNNGKIIGVDSDQSGLSDTVITSAEKGIEKAVEDMLKEYRRGNFIGNNVVSYSAKNDGIGLEMENAAFNNFNEDIYKQVLKSIESGKVIIKKDTEVESVNEFKDKNIAINYVK